MAVASRTERTEARLLPEQKRRIERAASIRGVSLSDFIVQNADEAAVRTIREHESWTLETKDRDFFVEALLQPAEPSARLKAAAERYRERVRE
jgi:uncharacterized protein (DUF1778 family)